MTLAEINNTQMQALGNRIKAVVLAQLRQQVPRRGNTPNNPYATGQLLGRINENMIIWEQAGEDNWRLSIDLEASGLPVRAKWTNFGTRNHNEEAAVRQAGMFGLPFEGYSKGGPGIRAQNWTSMLTKQSQIEALIRGQLRQSVEQFLQSTIQDITR